MSNFSSQIMAAFNKRASRAVEAPKWGVTFHVFPLTLLQLETIDSEPNDFRRSLRAIFVRGKNADGSPVFDAADFEIWLTHGVGDYGPSEVFEIAKAINSDAPSNTREGADAVIEDIEGN